MEKLTLKGRITANRIVLSHSESEISLPLPEGYIGSQPFRVSGIYNLGAEVEIQIRIK